MLKTRFMFRGPSRMVQFALARSGPHRKTVCQLMFLDQFGMDVVRFRCAQGPLCHGMVLVQLIMLSSHLPQTPCDKFVYDFLCGFWGIVGGYGLRRMCSHCLRALRDFLYGPSGASRGKSVQRLCGDCTEFVQSQWSCRAVSAASRR